MVLAQDDDG